MTAKSFVFSSGGGGVDIYTKSDAVPGVAAEVYINRPDDIDLYLNSDGSKTHNDALFNSVYGAIDADVVWVYIDKTYSSDPSSKFASYAASLISSGKMTSCSESGGDWNCEKIGELTYYWQTSGYSATWAIIK